MKVTLANARKRKEEDAARIRGPIEATRRELQLAEALGYGTMESYKPLYAQLDEIQKKADSGQSGKNLFDRIRNSLKNFKFSSQAVASDNRLLRRRDLICGIASPSCPAT